MLPDNYNGAPSYGSAWDTRRSHNQVRRGGSWDYDAVDCRAANRSYTLGGSSNRNLGFRVAALLRLPVFSSSLWGLFFALYPVSLCTISSFPSCARQRALIFLWDTHLGTRFKIVGCVAICNLQIKSTISHIRTACTEVRETGFLRGGWKKPGFFDKSKLGSKYVTKTRFLICARGWKKPDFFDKSKREAKIVAKTRFLILDNIIWRHGFPWWYNMSIPQKSQAK